MKAELEKIVAQMHGRGMCFEEALREFQSIFILTVLQDSKGNQCRAAKKLGMHRNTLRRTIRSLQLDLLLVRTSFRRRPPLSQALALMPRATRTAT